MYGTNLPCCWPLAFCLPIMSFLSKPLTHLGTSNNATHSSPNNIKVATAVANPNVNYPNFSIIGSVLELFFIVAKIKETVYKSGFLV